MSSDIAYFPQEYWNNSLAIGHPLVYQSHANSKHTIDHQELEDHHVSFLFVRHSFVYIWAKTLDFI